MRPNPLIAIVVICLLGEVVLGLVVCITANGISGAAAGLCTDGPSRQAMSEQSFSRYFPAKITNVC